ncbi:MAG: DUF3800 domain-containing protein [Eubacteriales bacterium]|nr:DUF3800 domain-containing protein [Eubacteriales bacterium]
MKYNVYCDESCHLENDGSSVMILGAVSCPSEQKRKIFDDIRAIKRKHGLDSRFEIKWTKVSASKIDFYLEIFNYFWENADLSYRGLVASGKDRLDHDKYNQGDGDLWYYKMYFLMLDPIINPSNEYQILVDIKDTRGGKRVTKLREVLCNNQYDFKQEVIKQIVQINSKESEILQLADLINGALGFYHRQLGERPEANTGKILLVKELQKRCILDRNAARNEQKFNLFIWKPRV